MELDYARDACWRSLDTQLQAPVRFEKRTAGIAVPNRFLTCDRPATTQRALTLSDVASEAAIATSREPLATISNVLAYRLLDGKVDIEGAAAFCGVGVQTLQRRLRVQGLTYRGLLGQVRLRRAKELLETTRTPISEIAYALGYEDHANLTHAFRKLAGRAPSSFRTGT